VISHDSNAPARVLAPKQFDLFHRGVKIIAGMDNEKHWVV
jgi:hypothetical protein